MTVNSAISWLRAAKRHFAGHERYRWWPLYSACMAVFMYTTWHLPHDWWTVIAAWRLHPWLIDMYDVAWNAGRMTCVILGVVGLMRTNWLARGLAGFGVWMGWIYLSYAGNPISEWWQAFTWYAFDAPIHWINGYVGDGTGLLTVLWCVYLGVLWVLIRPLAKRAYRMIPVLQARILERWPVMERFNRPVM